MSIHVRTRGERRSVNPGIEVTRDVNEQRGERRDRVLKTGWIITGDKAPKIACTVRDLSRTGARLLVPSSTFGVPREFKLMIGGSGPRSCRVAWRTEAAIGVEFQ